MSQISPLIEIDDLVKTFDDGKTAAVRNFSISIVTGSFVALIGASGSGKTTLLKIINRLVEPDSGSVRIAGVPAEETDAPKLRRGIGYVFQGIGLFPHMTISENIAITPRLLGWDEGIIKERVSELLDVVALPSNFASRFPAALSGGQQQRVGVARAIAARPQIVLMDEPFGALDPITRDSLGTAYRSMHDRLGLTTLMVTHDVPEALLLADRIVVLAAGQVIADGTPKALLSERQTGEVEALMASPRRQAERIRAIFEGSD